MLSIICGSESNELKTHQQVFVTVLLEFLETHFERDQIHLHLLDRLGSRDLCYRIIDKQLALGATAFKHEQLKNVIVSNVSFVDYILQ